MRWIRPTPPLRYRERPTAQLTAEFLRFRAMIRIAKLDRDHARLAELRELLELPTPTDSHHAT